MTDEGDTILVTIKMKVTTDHRTIKIDGVSVDAKHGIASAMFTTCLKRLPKLGERVEIPSSSIMPGFGGVVALSDFVTKSASVNWSEMRHAVVRLVSDVDGDNE